MTGRQVAVRSSACSHTRGAVYFWAWVGDGQARSNATASTDKKYQLQKRRRIFFMSACSHTRGAVYFWAWVGDGQASSSSIIDLLTYARRGLIAVTKYKRAITARFLSVAKGNISRLRDAQAFHAAVKRPPYFTFARQRRHFTARRGSLPGLRGLILGLVCLR